MNWLDELIKEHSEFESPMSFWWWGALSTISAVVKDNVWMDRYLYNLYPNIYVMLHADSGLKKGPPINMAKKLCNMTGGVKVITGRSSLQGILKEMGTVQLKPEDKGKVNNKSNVFICSSELSSSIVDDPVATKILTDLFDRHYNADEWKSLLKMEQFVLKDPTVGMFTATNESMGEDFFTKSAIKGGFMARTFIIYEGKRNRKNSLAYRPENMPNYEKYVKFLKQIAALRGPFKSFDSLEPKDEYQFSKQVEKVDGGTRTIYFTHAGKIYDDWYDQFTDLVDAQQVKDETGTLNRFGDAVLKVAMLLSLAERPTLEISETAMVKAIGICEKLLGNIRRTTLGKQGLSNSAVLKTMIINELFTRENHSISREVLMKKMWTHYTDATEFDNIMQSFDAAGLIKTTAPGNVILYTMPPNQVKELEEYFKGKSSK
jgi:hypothetical protein